MKSNESDIAIKEPHEPELPDLVVRALSDFERIIEGEAHLLEENIFSAAQTLFDRLYIQAILIALAVIGGAALLVSLALLLHQWMRWWEALGLMGLCALVAAEVLRRSLVPSTATQAARAVTGSRL
jgi:uncharacterized membrane protein